MASEWIPWGKLRRLEDGQVAAMHPLLDHLLDVTMCFMAVTRCGGVRRSLQVAAGPGYRRLSDVDWSRLAVLTFLHDIGKANAGFQSRHWNLHADRPLHWPTPCGHGADGWVLFKHGVSGADRILQGLPLAAMAAWGAVVPDLLHASISHHGRPVDEQDSHGAGVWQPVRNGAVVVYDPADAVASMGQAIQHHYPLAFDASAAPLPDTPAFVHLFAGLVQLTDWLGSDTREGFFPYSQLGEDRAVTAERRAAHALRAIGLNVEEPRHSLSVHMPSFEVAFGVPQPRPMQAAMASDSLGPVVVLEAETGSGKTEAALWRFLHLFNAGTVDALYFALPTRVAATQLHDRVADFVRRVWPSHAPVVVRALPGYAAADGATFARLPEFQVLWADKPGDQEAERRWAAESPKRYLAATIAVGTVDQALLGALQIKHAHLRQALLARSLLVVDEVHASDAYMTTLLVQLLRAHVACGGQALLLSATLGATARTRYLEVGTATRGAGTPPLAEALDAPYPAISTRTAKGLTLQAVQGNPLHKLVHWRTLDTINEPERIAELAVQAAAQGARVLVVRNTVPAAVATLQAVEALTLVQGGDWLFKLNGVSTLHHSRFSRQDRPLLDAAVQDQIGKHRKQPGGRIVIGTQTLEQSLDIDADLLITDLCPMDVLLQRLGRLHRHVRPTAANPQDMRPVGYAEARAWVLTPDGHELESLLTRSRHGLGPIHTREARMQGVYVDVRSLEATRRLIDAQPTRHIPAENRLLVEQATHGEALDAVAEERGPGWKDFGTQYEGAVGARASVARLQALPYAEPYYPGSFPEDEYKLGSRLGAADRLVLIDPPQPGPFGQIVRELALRHHQLPRGLPIDARPVAVRPLPEGGGFDFTLGAACYRYSRLGLERLKEESSDAL